METSIFNEFLVLEEQNSFSKAAKALSMSQATLSRHIKQLEDEYGVLLFERTTQKMKLTPYGEALIPYARTIVEQNTEYKRAVERIKFKASSHLTIGTVDFPYFYGITSLLAGFKKAHFHTTLEVHMGSVDDLKNMLDAGFLDIAFIRDISDLSDKYVYHLYREDFLYMVVPANHPLAGRQSARIFDFADETFYFRCKKDSLMDQFYMKTFRNVGFIPKRAISQGSRSDSVINNGTNISIATDGLANTLRGNLHVKVLDLEPKVHCDICIARNKQIEPSDLALSFYDYVLENIAVR